MKIQGISTFRFLPCAALLACTFIERTSARVAVSVDWSQLQTSIDPVAYGCNAPFLFNDTNSTSPAYQSIMRTTIDMRGGAALKVQSSGDIGITDPWTSNKASVPNADATVNGVIFDITDDGDFINVIADIPVTGTRLFVRLNSSLVN